MRHIIQSGPNTKAPSGGQSSQAWLKGGGGRVQKFKRGPRALGDGLSGGGGAMQWQTILQYIIIHEDHHQLDYDMMKRRA